MRRLDVEADAQAAFAVLRGSGSAILPVDVGYSLIGGSTAALIRTFEAKGRTPEKLNAMIGDGTLARELFDLPPERRAMLEAITEEHDLPLGAIAPAEAVAETGRAARRMRDRTLAPAEPPVEGATATDRNREERA